MAKIYTRTGDNGETSLVGGQRVRKDDLRIEAIGSADELNAAIGLVRVELARSGVAPEGLDAILALSQHRLFELGAELATPGDNPARNTTLSDSTIVQVEEAIDDYESDLEPLRAFILPGGAAAAAQLHMTRCVCRRCERRLVELAAIEPVRGELLRYVNRLSDLLFVLARTVNQANRLPDVLWKQPQKGAGRKGEGRR